MEECAICKSKKYLVYVPKTDGGVLYTAFIMCEGCYAKKNFAHEYPNLSKMTLEHIRMLPHVPNTTPPLSISGVSFGSGFCNVPSQSNQSFPMIPNTDLLFGAQGNPNTISYAGGFQLPNFPNMTQKDTKPNSSKLLRTYSTHPSLNQSMPIQSSGNMTYVPVTSSSSSTYNPDTAKRINEFIKRTLLPELMDFPDPTPNTKHPRVDTYTESADTEPEEDTSEWPFEWIGGNVKNISDLIRIGKEYKEHPKRVHTNLDLVKLSHLVEPLETLQNMVGLEDIKDSIFKQVVFHLQELDNGNKDMHHTVIKGPPGVGKTQISHIIARIYKGLGFLKKDTVVSVKRDDLIAGYLGQTAMKAKKKYEEALGGVLLIDEAYALGDGSDKDSYSKEAIDLLTSYLSEHGHEFICIIAGYKEALEKRFFSVNEGLARRFNIHYEIKPYSGADVCQIFQKLVTDGGWQLDASAYDPEFFVANIDAFPHFGGDMQNLFAYTKKAHSTRLLAIRTKEQLMDTKKKINKADLEAGFEQFKAGNGYATKDTSPFEAKFMYM